MPENDSFIGNMSGVRFVRYMAELAGLPRSEALERAHEALFYVGLGEVRYRKVSTYSLGMKQLIKLAQALAHGPRLLILDEPTNGLDPMARQRMIQTIQEIRKEGSIRLLISSHLLRDIDETCDEVLILKNGRIAALCNIEEERRSHRNFIELETVGATDESLREACANWAANAPPSPAAASSSSCPTTSKPAISTSWPPDQGVQIRRMHQRRDSLEDIFLRAMDNAGQRTREGNLSVYKHDYRAYTGRVTPLWTRVLVLARYGLAEAWSSKITIGLFTLLAASHHRLPRPHLSRQQPDRARPHPARQ